MNGNCIDCRQKLLDKIKQIQNESRPVKETNKISES